MADWLAVIILGIIEGVTEFLPVSSTGHLLLAQRWLEPQSELFTFVIQSGAVLAVFMVFYRRVWELMQTWRTAATQQYLGKLAVSFGIGMMGGLALKQGGVELPETAEPVAWATLIGGVLILWLERAIRGKPLREEITWTVAIAVGVAQLVALVFPGTSRSGATILVALALGTHRMVATEYSFLLGVPSLLAAGGYQVLKYFKDPEPTGERWDLVLLGTVVAGVTAFIVVKWLLRFVQSHTFVMFGWYRIVLGALILLAVFGAKNWFG